ncbi:MAG: paraslipin, partial [Planctomycetes bacterium]|nr:paraslipin [Planctomycetota bacterium]
AKTNNSIIIPSDLSDIAGMIKAVSSVIKDKTESVGQA